MAITHTNIAIEESATVTARVASVQIARGSTNEQQEILVLGDPESSLGVARVLDTAPASTHFAVAVRLASGPSSVADCAIRAVLPSSQADNRATVYQSTAADLNVTVAGYSTIATVSTGSVRVHQSTAADLLVTATPDSTAWSVLSRITTSSGGSVEGSTTTPSTGSVLGLHVRPVQPSGRQSTTTLITSTHSAATYELISSAASLKHKVKAFLVTSTHTFPSTLVFMSSLAIDRWHAAFGSGSSGVTGAGQTIQAPDFLFETDVANALNVRIEGGTSSAASTTIARVSVSWFTEA